VSKLVEDLRDRIKQAEIGGGYVHLGISTTRALLAHIERLEARQVPAGCVVIPVYLDDEVIEAMKEALTADPDDVEGAYEIAIDMAGKVYDNAIYVYEDAQTGQHSGN
jgi:hypothetical protein